MNNRKQLIQKWEQHNLNIESQQPGEENCDGSTKNRESYQSKVSDDEIEDDNKMSKFKAYMALCKGYCAINILVLPK